jgi:hypothetical protein
VAKDPLPCFRPHPRHHLRSLVPGLLLAAAGVRVPFPWCGVAVTIRVRSLAGPWVGHAAVDGEVTNPVFVYVALVSRGACGGVVRHPVSVCVEATSLCPWPLVLASHGACGGVGMRPAHAHEEARGLLPFRPALASHGVCAGVVRHPVSVCVEARGLFPFRPALVNHDACAGVGMRPAVSCDCYHCLSPKEGSRVGASVRANLTKMRK